MKNENESNYYANIPAGVRYNKNLSMGAKMLYGEITALCNKEGYCWATNAYFAKLYDTHRTTISRWVSELVQEGWIHVELSKTKHGYRTERKVWITPKSPYSKNATRRAAKMHAPYSKNATQNTTVNTTFNKETVKNGSSSSSNSNPDSVLHRPDHRGKSSAGKEAARQYLINLGILPPIT